MPFSSLSVLLCPTDAGSLESVFTELLRDQGFSVELLPHVGPEKQNDFTNLHGTQPVLRRTLYSSGWTFLLRIHTFGSTK